MSKHASTTAGWLVDRLASLVVDGRQIGEEPCLYICERRTKSFMNLSGLRSINFATAVGKITGRWPTAISRLIPGKFLLTRRDHLFVFVRSVRASLDGI